MNLKLIKFEQAKKLYTKGKEKTKNRKQQYLGKCEKQNYKNNKILQYKTFFISFSNLSSFERLHQLYF